MPDLDRAELLDLLRRLGAEDDATVLAAARELNGKLRESGLTCKYVAKAVGLSKWMVCAHISILQKQKAMESPQPAPTPS